MTVGDPVKRSGEALSVELGPGACSSALGNLALPGWGGHLGGWHGIGSGWVGNWL